MITHLRNGIVRQRIVVPSLRNGKIPIYPAIYQFALNTPTTSTPSKRSFHQWFDTNNPNDSKVPSSYTEAAHKVMDDHHNIKFQTLHELQKNACIAYAENPLFGTFVPTPAFEGTKPKGPGGQFEWMSYKEFDENVTKCRSVLKDLGELHSNLNLSCQKSIAMS